LALRKVKAIFKSPICKLKEKMTNLNQDLTPELLLNKELKFKRTMSVLFYELSYYWILLVGYWIFNFFNEVELSIFSY